jgi:hypothetical protein
MTTDQPWRISANQRERRSFDVFDGPTEVDITGWTIDAKIRTRPGGDILHTFPAERAVIESGRVVCTIPAPISAAWAWTSGWYRIVVTNPASPADDPDRSRVLQGPLVVDPD